MAGSWGGYRSKTLPILIPILIPSKVSQKMGFQLYGGELGGLP